MPSRVSIFLNSNSLGWMLSVFGINESFTVYSYLNRLLNFGAVQICNKEVWTSKLKCCHTYFFSVLASSIVMVPSKRWPLFIWFLSLNIIVKRFIHVVACSQSFLLIAKWHSIMWMIHNYLSILLLMCVWIVSQFGALINSAAIDHSSRHLYF